MATKHHTKQEHSKQHAKQPGDKQEPHGTREHGKEEHGKQASGRHDESRGHGESHRATAAQHEPKTKREQEKDEAVRRADDEAKRNAANRPDRTAGQNEAVDQKRNDEQQYHAGGVAHDPHNRTQERVNAGDPDAGDIDEESRSEGAPFNKTYGKQG